MARSTRALLAMVIVVVFATAAAAGCGSDDGYPQNGVYEMPNYQSGNLSYRAATTTWPTTRRGTIRSRLPSMT